MFQYHNESDVENSDTDDAITPSSPLVAVGSTTSEDEQECSCEQLFQTLKVELDLERKQRIGLESMVISLQEQIDHLQQLVLLESTSTRDCINVSQNKENPTVLMPTTYKPSRSKSLINRPCNNNNINNLNSKKSYRNEAIDLYPDSIKVLLSKPKK